MLKRYASSYIALPGLPDFGPISQDRIAIKQIAEQGVLVHVQAGRIAEAIGKCSNIWASLPGNNYGQRVHAVDDLVAHYIVAGGVMA